MTVPTVDRGPIVTCERLLQWEEEEKGIAPFTPDEKAIALSVANAFHYAYTLLEELPQSAQLHTFAAMAWSHGMQLVLERREGRIGT